MHNSHSGWGDYYKIGKEQSQDCAHSVSRIYHTVELFVIPSTRSSKFAVFVLRKIDLNFGLHGLSGLPTMYDCPAHLI